MKRILFVMLLCLLPLAGVFAQPAISFNGGTGSVSFPSSHATEGGYVRPSFWPELPKIPVDLTGQPTEYAFYGLVAVFPESTHGTQVINFIARSNCVVVWGDGVTENVNNDAVASHTYKFSEMAGSPCELGYKIASLSIKGQSEYQQFYGLYGFNLRQNQFLDVRFSVSKNPSQNYFNISNMPIAEQIELVGYDYQMTWGNSLGAQCPALKKIIVDQRISKPDSMFTGVRAPFSDLGGTWDFSKVNSAVYGLNATFHTMYLGGNGEISFIAPAYSFSANGTFYDCNATSIVSVGDNFSNCNNTHNSAFSLNPRLANLRLPGIKVSFNIANCNLSSSALATLFGDLADMTSQSSPTITITGNPGVADLTAEQIAIATGKNWTIVN